MTDEDDKLTVEKAANALGITVEEYRQKVRASNAERIGVSIDIFAKRLELIQAMTDNNNRRPLKGFVDYSDVGEETLYPDQLKF